MSWRAGSFTSPQKAYLGGWKGLNLQDYLGALSVGWRVGPWDLRYRPRLLFLTDSDGSTIVS